MDGSSNFNHMASAIVEIKKRKYSKGGSMLPLDGAQDEKDYTARQVPSVKPVETHIPTEEELFITDGSFAHGHRVPNAPYLKQHFLKEGRLLEEHAFYILEEATRTLTLEPNMLEIQGSTTVCGDIHGQYFDLMKLFEVGGNLTDNKYLFLGDYVDRGSFGIECLLYLFALKLQFPNSIFLLRGNHECRHLTEYFTFKRECLHKYSRRIYEAAIKSFQALPIAAVLDGKFFCVHGGLSPDLRTLADVQKLDRFQEPGHSGLLCDLLWSDPAHDFGNEAPHHQHTNGFVSNDVRGCSFFFTYEATCQFLERNRLLSVIRGHEAQEAGYQMYKRTQRQFPAVITIFSAPNYLDVHQNRAAVLKYVNKNIVLRQFNSSPHPFWLPNFMDAFTWSLPFVGTKIAEMFLAILSICSEEELVDSDESDDLDAEERLADLALSDQEIMDRKEKIRAKVLAVGRMARAFKMLREESENVSEFRTSSFPPGSAEPGLPLGLPRHSLGVGSSVIKQNMKGFDDARRYDIDNEKIPFYQAPQTEFEQTFPAPSLRQAIPGRPSSSMGFLSRGFDDPEGDEGDEEINRLADRVARLKRSKSSGSRPYDALKRHETF